jgi:hypothetical protein
MARDHGSPSQDDLSRESAGESTNGPRQFNSELAKVGDIFSSIVADLTDRFHVRPLKNLRSRCATSDVSKTDILSGVSARPAPWKAV